jgi:HSP20 family molecular chaperone IbpA
MSSRIFASPLFLGFDHLEHLLERAQRLGTEGYPPYNIEALGPERLRITLAVAGFGLDDLAIWREGNQLLIRGRQSEDGAGRVFLHRGIAARQFQKAFVLADGIEVAGAWLDNGLLHVDLLRPAREDRVRVIAIRTPERASRPNRGPAPGSAPGRAEAGGSNERKGRHGFVDAPLGVRSERDEHA